MNLGRQFFKGVKSCELLCDRNNQLQGHQDDVMLYIDHTYKYMYMYRFFSKRVWGHQDINTMLVSVPR